MALTREQIRATLTSPLIYIDTNRSEIDARKENYLLCSPEFVNIAYRGIIIVDSKGTTFKIKRVIPIGKINILLSIKNFGSMQEVLPEIDGDIENISLHNFKELIISTVLKKPNEWTALDSIENISNQVRKCKTYKEVMRIFNLGLR